MAKIYSDFSVYLKPLATGDADQITENANDYEVAYNLGIGGFPFPYKREDALQFIESATRSLMEGKEAHFGIHLSDGDALIGVSGFYSLDFRDRKGYIGYWIGKRYWRRGYGKEALRLLLNFGFAAIGLNRISAVSFTFNSASEALLKSLGFTKEGTMREDTFDGSKYLDSEIFSLLKREYKESAEIKVEGFTPLAGEKGAVTFSLS